MALEKDPHAGTGLSGRTSIRAKLIKSFTVAILIPSLITIVVGVMVIRRQIYTQAEAQVNSDLQGALEIWRSQLERLKDAARIHATRMVIYRALEQKDPANLEPEMERIRKTEALDFLALTDTQGRVLYRTRNPLESGDSQAGDELVRHAMLRQAPGCSAVIMNAAELAKESLELLQQAFMEITPTPMAGPSSKMQESAGMVLKVAAPVVSARGAFLGVLYGGVLLNRNYDFVDKVRRVIFKEELYEGRERGTATIFQDDVRVSTNVKNSDGTRAITTQVSAEVAQAVLRLGRTWLGRAFVVNDWYISAYAPIRDFRDQIIGMLYVGTLERPFTDSLWRALFIFLGITLLGVGIVSGVAVNVAGRISRPIHAMAAAARQVADGDYSASVEVTVRDEIGYLAECFNRMVEELGRANQELREWAETLEGKVEERTAQVKSMQSQLIQAEKLAAIGKLAAGVAHEINNPLTGILTNSSLMLEDLDEEDPRREDLKIIVEETLRCRKIVKGLLDFARQTKPLKQAVNLNTVAEDVLNLVRNQASFKDITLETSLDPTLPPVMADKDQMRQVVLNIVLNAAEAIVSGGKICISSSLDPASRKVELKIKDTGPGIPEEIKGKLFEPFITTKKSGTGLGLAIAYGIMERHRGIIAVESSPGRGTAITLRIPAEDKE